MNGYFGRSDNGLLKLNGDKLLIPAIRGFEDDALTSPVFGIASRLI